MRLLPGVLCGAFALSALAAAPNDTTPTRPLFDPAAMVLPGVDVSRYSREEYFPPGNYLVDVVVNQRMRGRDTIRFVLSGSGKLRPCMDVKLLEHFSIDVNRAPLADAAADRDAVEEPAGCANALATIQFAESWFNHRQLVLNITVPQVAIVREMSTRSVELDKLDDGVPAGIVNYTFNNYFRDTNTASAINAQYLSVNGRFNIGPWRLFWGGSAQMGTGTSGLRWRNSVFYGERAFNPLNARLAFGQIQSTGDLLPGVPLLAVADYRSAVTNALNSYYLSYSRMFGEVRTFFTYDRTDVAGRPAVNRLGLSFSIPLGPREAGSSRSVVDTYVSTAQGVTSVSHSSNYSTRLNDQLYNISGSYGYGASDPTDGTLGVGVSSAFDSVALAAGMSVNSKSRTFSVSGSGALVAHEGGVTFLRSAPDTAALVYAPGAGGASVRGGTRIDDAGYGLVYLVPLQDNIVEIDTRGAAPDLELKSSRKYAAPSRGAYLKVEFEPREGRSVLIEGTTVEGKPLPFGARVTDASGAEVGIVGQGGNIFARVANDKGQLRVSWGPEDTIACDLDYELQEVADSIGAAGQPSQRLLPNLSAVCNLARVAPGAEMAARDAPADTGMSGSSP